MMKMRISKAAIFDLDGTLLDSMGVWEKIDADFLAKRQIALPENYVHEVYSKSFRDAAEYTIALFGLKESANDIIEEWNRMAVDEYRHHVSLKPYVREYLLYLQEDGIKIGAATALPGVLYEPALKNNGIYHLFDAFSSVFESGLAKDDAEVYLAAARKLGVSPCACMAFEDVLPGIRGIIAAGMRAFGVYDRHSEHDRVQMQKLAEGYIHSFSEMLLHHYPVRPEAMGPPALLGT